MKAVPERDIMPHSMMRFSWLALILVVTGTGCATNPSGSMNLAAGVFRESSSDVYNRAPDALSVPQDAATGTQIDSLQMRSQADYHFTLGESYALEGNPTRAIEEYKLTLVYDPKSALVRLRLAGEYYKQNLISEAIEQAKSALEYESDMVDAHLLLGMLYTNLRMYAEALTQYQKVILIAPENTEAPMYVGALYAEQKRYPEAIETFERLTKNKNYRSPHVAWYYIGRIRIEEGAEGAKAKAEKAFLQALDLKPDFADAALSLSSVYETSTRRKEAKTLLVNFQQKHGPDPGVAEALGRLYIEDDEHDKAFEQFEVIEARNSDDLNNKIKMAYILIEKKQFTDAIIKLEEILARAPYSDKVRFYLGAVYEQITDYKNAIGHFQKIPIGSSYYAEAVIHTAYLYKLRSDYSEAVKTIEVAIKGQPDQPQFYALYASLLEDLKEYNKAVQMLSSAVSKFPEHAQLHFFLGSMQDRIGEVENTETSMKRVLQIDENHVQALNYLAYTYADHSKNLDEAEKMVRRALELQPSDGYILDTLGWVLYKKGDITSAVKTLEAAFNAQPAESVIAEHLGDAYYKYQLPDKARKMYQKAAEIETDQGNAKKIRAKIDSIEKQMQSVALPDRSRNPTGSDAKESP